MRISIQLVQDLDTRIWKITSCVNVTIFLILEKENSIETDMYIIWTIMYDYKLANIPRIIGVMRSRLTDNTLKAAESRLSGPPLPRRQSLRALVTSPRREECTEAESSVLSSIPDSISKRRIPFFLEESPYRNLNSIFARSRFIYERDRRPAFPPCLRGRKLREHVQLNKWNVNIWFITHC